MKRLLAFLFLVALTAQAQLQLQIVGSVTNLLQKAGDTSTGPQLTTSSSTNAPSLNEFVTANYVNSLLANDAILYNTTNILVGATNSLTTNTVIYQFSNTIPAQFSRVYTLPTNGQYIGCVAITNVMDLDAPIIVGAYLGGISAGGSPAISLHAEIYWTTNYANGVLEGDYDSGTQNITIGSTNKYDFVVNFPNQHWTTPHTVYRFFKIDQNPATHASLAICGGTNTPGQISYQSSVASGGNYIGTFTGNGSGLTNIPQSSITNATPALTNGDTRNVAFAGSITGNGVGITNVPYTISGQILLAANLTASKYWSIALGGNTGSSSTEAFIKSLFVSGGPTGGWISNLWFSIVMTNFSSVNPWGQSGTNITVTLYTNGAASSMSMLFGPATNPNFNIATNLNTASSAFFLTNGSTWSIQLTPNAGTAVANTLFNYGITVYPR